MLLVIAFRNLVQARRRTALIATALAIVTMVMTLLLSLSQGLSETLLVSGTTLSSGHVNVGGFYKMSPRDASPIINDEAKLTQLINDNVKGVDYVVGRLRGWAKAVSPKGSVQVGITGLDLNREPTFAQRLQVVAGDVQSLRELNTAIIFEAQAKRLEVGVGDVVTLSFEAFTGQRDTGEVRVGAIAKDMGFMSGWSLFVSNDSLRTMYRIKSDVTGALHVYLKDVGQSAAVLEQLQGVFKNAGYTLMDHEGAPFWMKFERVGSEDWTGLRLDLTTWDEELAFLQWVVTGLDMIAFFLAAILMVIIGIGFMNTMWIAVRERTPEIGTMRAIGMRRRKVLVLFLLEATMLGLIATGIGALLGGLVGVTLDHAQIRVPYEAAQAVLMSDVLHLSVKPALLIKSVLGFTFITALAALWPALRAARMRPVTAIGHVS